MRLCGNPSKRFSGSGGEWGVCLTEFKNFYENFDTEISANLGELPWSNGVCKRYNAIPKGSFFKSTEDTNCQWEVALAWAVSAKHLLLMLKASALINYFLVEISTDLCLLMTNYQLPFLKFL